MGSWKKVVTSGSSPVFNDTSICGTLALGNFTDVSASLASLGGTSITRADLVYTSSGVENSSQPTHITNVDGSLKIIATGSRSVVLNASKNLPNIISGSYGQYATEVIVNGISNVIRQTGAEASTVQNTNVTILNGYSNLISSSVDSSILSAAQSTIQGVRYSIIGGGNSNCIITDCAIGGSCSSGGHAIVAGQNNRISGSSGASNHTWWNTIGGGHQNILYQTGCSIIGAGHANQILGNNACFGNSNKQYRENSIVGGRCNDIIDERNSHIIGGACNKIIGDSTQNTVTQGSGNIIGAGHCNVITGSCCSAILGGKNNCLKHDNSFIIGSCITSSAACTTFVNNLCVLGNLSEAIQATGSVDISGSLSITGFANVSSSLAAASSIPTLQEVTDAGASTTTAVTLANLTVTGTASFQHTTDLDIADRFIKLASGSNADGVGGIAIQQTSATDAQAFGWDNATGRWGITSSFNASQNTFTPSAYMGTVINGTDNDPNNLDSSLHKAGNIYIDTDNSTDGIWLFG